MAQLPDCDEMHNSFTLKCWFDPIQVRLNTIKEFVNMMAFMFCSYLATTMEDI